MRSLGLLMISVTDEAIGITVEKHLHSASGHRGTDSKVVTKAGKLLKYFWSWDAGYSSSET
jgi:hypothetical protein